MSAGKPRHRQGLRRLFVRPSPKMVPRAPIRSVKADGIGRSHRDDPGEKPRETGAKQAVPHQYDKNETTVAQWRQRLAKVQLKTDRSKISGHEDDEQSRKRGPPHGGAVDPRRARSICMLP